MGRRQEEVEGDGSQEKKRRKVAKAKYSQKLQAIKVVVVSLCCSNVH